MPWMKKDLMSLRGEFVHLVETERLLLATLCQRFGISHGLQVAGAGPRRGAGGERCCGVGMVNE